MVNDRIKEIYKAIDQIFEAHGKPRPEHFGGDVWNYQEELTIWKKKILANTIRNPLSELQWKVIDNYIQIKESEITK